MSKASKAAKKSAAYGLRREAEMRLHEIRAVAHDVRVNDLSYVHITVWLSASWKVEWWPSPGKWALSQAITKTGSFDEFKSWIAANRKHDDPEDDFDLIERPE